MPTPADPRDKVKGEPLRLVFKPGRKKTKTKRPVGLPPKQAEIPDPEQWSLSCSHWKALLGTAGETGASLYVNTDSQTVAGWLNGSTCMADTRLEPYCDHVTWKMVSIRERCNFLTSGTNLWISWHKREFNLLADFAVNLCLDRGADFELWSSRQFRDVVPGSRILCASDGGHRGFGGAAFGWSLTLWNPGIGGPVVVATGAQRLCTDNVVETELLGGTTYATSAAQMD